MKYINGVYTHCTLEEGYDFYITDRYKKKYHFKIASFPVPSGLLSEAWEVIEDPNREPHTFTILSDFDEDEEYAEMLLMAKVKKGIDKRYLKEQDGKLTIKGLKGFGGRIDWSGNRSDTGFDHMLVVDGKRVTIEDFAEMIQPYGGFNLRLTFHDPTDDIPD